MGRFTSLQSSKALYGLRNAGAATKARPMHRQHQHTTFLATGALKQRQSHSTAFALRRIHIRAISYSSIPRFVARAFRIPIATVTVGAGGLSYANYKFEGQ